MSTAEDQWVRRPPTRDEVHTDVIFAVCALCLGVLSLLLFRVMGYYEDPAGPVVSLACMTLNTLPLALRRVFPGTVTVLVSAGMVLAGELHVPETLITSISVFLALYTLGAWSRDRRRARLVRWSVVVGMGLWLLSGFMRETLADPQDGSDLLAGEMTPALAFWLYQLLVNVLYFAAAIWFGQHSWERARTEARLQDHAEQLRAERAVVAEQAVSLERLRIARELHDSVAHHVSLMGVQAGAARTLLAEDPDAAEGFIRQIEDSARRSVQEMQTILGVLRDRDGESETPSSVGVDQIEELLDSARKSGLDASLTVHGDPRALRPVHSLTLYRIAQEALTNIRKHAGPGAAADLRLRWRPSSVELEVLDDGAGRRSHTAHRSEGHGLPGMRERCAALGGTFEAGPREQAGFFVRAELPFQPQTGEDHAGEDHG